MSQYEQLSKAMQAEILRERIHQVEQVLFTIRVELDEFKAISTYMPDSAVTELSRAIADKSLQLKYNEVRLHMLLERYQQLVEPPATSEATAKPVLGG